LLHHVEIYVSDLEKSIAFWTPFMTLLGYEDNRWSGGMNYVKEGQAYFCFLPAPREHLAAGYHRKRVGLNHLAFQGKSRAEDYSLFQTPVFVLINNPQKPGWFVTSQEGRLDSNNEWFTLSQEVVARQTSEKHGETTITTSELRLNTREQFADTRKAVTMRAAKSQITGMGMHADMKRDRIQLLSNVKGTYEP